jgi:GT2 family glycosyltransferase
VKLSVVVVNYNTREDLRLCLAALHECQPIPEIIVVDNASSDGSAAMVRNKFPGVTLLTPEQNTWFCGGNNLGVQAAHGEYVLLLNPDTIAPPDALLTMTGFMDEHPDYAGATMQLRYPSGEIQRTCSRAPTYRYLLLTQTPLRWLFTSARQRAESWHWYDGWSRDVDYDVEAVPGSCTLMRKDELWLEDRLLLYFPEDDLAQRNRGRRFRFLASPHIIHREKSATRTALATRIYFRDLLVYTRKHHGSSGAALLWLLTRPMVWAMALRWWLRRFESKEGADTPSPNR